MPTLQDVQDWIAENVLDTSAWDRYSDKQAVAVKQAERNLTRWFPDVELTVEVVALQSVWEVWGIDPVLKYQRFGVRSLMDSGEMISYKDGERPELSPEVSDILGSPTGGNGSGSGQRQYGGILI